MTVSNTSPIGERARTTVLVWTDAVAYALVLTLALTAGAVFVGVASGGGLVRGKFLLFLVGFGLLMYATARLWPSTPDDVADDSGRTAGVPGESIPETPGDTRFRALVWALPPMRWLPPPPPGERISTGGKVFLGGVFVLFVSYAMEAVFGVA